MKKKVIIILISLIAILLILGIFFLLRGNKEKVYVSIYLLDNSEPKNSYNLKLLENGKYKLNIAKYLEPTTPTEIKYSDTLNEIELELLNKIINYIKDKKEITEKEYIFNYDENKDNYAPEELDILENTVKAIEFISMGDIEIDGTTRRDFGVNMLDNIVTTQLIN